VRTPRPAAARSRRVAAALLAVAFAALLLVAVPASAWELVKGPPTESVVPWRFESTPGTESPRSITIWLDTGYCAGEPRPVAAKPTIEERPGTAASPNPKIVITAHQVRPAPNEVVGEMKPGEGKYACKGLGYTIAQRVALKHPIAGTVFLDGFYHPPRLVLPPSPPARPPSG
jgi:hypothetical protein